MLRKSEILLGNTFLLLAICLTSLPIDVSGGPLEPYTGLSCTLPLNFKCTNGYCIKKEKHCDGQADCADGADEINCGDQSCNLPLWWRCNDGTCMTSLFRCNGENDCPDFSDEHDCLDDFKQDAPLFVNCTKKQYSCGDGLCIPSDWRCNGEPDCHDGSDELNCTKVACKGFVCANEHCIINEWKCDGHDDCGDNSDETNCGLAAIPCNLNHELFMCADNSSCISAYKVCDHTNDCRDGSDEGGDCITRNNCASMKCSHSCVNTPQGPQCTCPPGYNQTSSTECVDYDECSAPMHLCSQQCVNLPGTYHCQCKVGYKLQDDNKSCKVTEGEGVMVFSTEDQIRAYHLTSEKYYSVSRKVNQALGVDYDGKYVYWTETRLGSEGIVRSFLNGSDKETLLRTGVGCLEDIAVDWLTGNLYFTDGELQHIGVCSNDGLHCSVLFSKAMKSPRAIVLHPLRGLMFWTDWGERPEIATANMDGSKDMAVIREDIKWPNGLTIDYPNDKLYWVEGHFSKLRSSNFDGSDRKTILENVHRPYWIAVFEDNLYWSDWGTKSIQTCDKLTGRNQRTLVTAKKIIGIHIHHPALTPHKSHACENSQCTHICLLSGTNSHSCTCPEDKILAHDGVSCIEAKQSQQLIISAGSDLMFVHHQTLGKHDIVMHEMKFLSIDCLAYDRRKGLLIVYDGRENVILSVENFGQDNEKIHRLVDTNIGYIEGMDVDYVTNLLYWCDVYYGTVEVMLLSTMERSILLNELNGDAAIDIALVPKYGFMFIAFRTVDGRIHVDRMGMDGKDRTIVIEHGYEGPTVRLCYDELTSQIFISDMGTRKIETIHIEGHGRQGFRELATQPVSMAVLGDFVFWTNFASLRLFWTQKLDLEKKVNKKITIELSSSILKMHVIAIKNLSPSSFLSHECSPNSTSNPCSHICVQSDRTRHIQSHTASPLQQTPSHTCLCPSPLVLGHDGVRCESVVHCNEKHFTCKKSNVCVDKARRCDGKVDCVNGEDEEGCAAHSKCHHDEFVCKNGQCIANSLRCDKHNDCSDASDESDCKNYDPKKHCDSEQFECQSGLCLDTRLVCDDHFDCPDNDDEVDCAENTCGPDQFRCKSSNCIPKSWECDGQLDCVDSSDEHNKCAYNKPCPAGLFHCRSGRCIDPRLVCDKMDDCGDGFDEMNCLTPQDKINEEKECKDDEYACETDTKICLPYSARCNGSSECPRGEDEINCWSCSHGEWACGSELDGSSKSTGGESKGQQQCIQEAWRCDGSNDCLDNSDEDDAMCKQLKEHPAASTHINRVLLELNKDTCDGGYLCSTGQCVDYSQLCDGQNNCYDGSDENGLCDKSCENSICAEVCTKSPRGAICLCHEGGQLAPDGHSCRPAPPACLARPAPCHHLCTSTGHSYVCSCFHGYMLRADRKSCKAVGEAMSILFIANNEIRKMIPQNNTVRVIHKGNFPKLTGLDVFSAKKSVFYSVQSLGRIHHLDFQSGKEIVVSELGKPTLLAVDWVTKNIYYFDDSVKKKFAVCHMDRQKCAMLQTIDDNITITAFVIDPINRVMFYSVTTWWVHNRSKSDIYKANLDGTHIVEMVSSNLTYCSGLAIDYEKKLLYFSDQQENKIETINYEATHRQIVLKDNTYIIKPFNLDIFEDEVYFMSFGTTKMTKCKIVGERKCMPFNLHAYGTESFRLDQTSKQKNVTDDCRNANCTNICIMAPLGFKCLCPDGTTVNEKVICNQTNQDKKPEFSKPKNLSSKSDHVPSTRSMGKSVAIVLVLFSIALFTVVGFVYVRRYRGIPKTIASTNFQVHFQNPTFSAMAVPFANIGSAISSRLPTILRQNQNEFENPLNSGEWPNDLDPKVIRMKQKIPGGQLQVPNLLVDSDSDVESDRDMHDADYKDKAKLLP